MKPERAGERVLVVEGPDDKAVVLQILQRHGVELHGRAPEVIAADGFGGVLKEVRVRARSTPRLGVVIDADQPEDRRWEQLRAALREVDVELPDAPAETGWDDAGWPSRPDWRLGVWVMPDNVSPGMLENFMAALVPEHGRGCWGYADQVTTEARGHGAVYHERHRSKAVLHTWLAWQDPPGLGLGTAIRQQVFTHDSIPARDFMAWYARLFEAPRAG